MMRFKTFILIVLFLAVATVAMAEPAKLVLKSKASITGRKVLLKDVALIKDADEAASAQLGYLSLGMAPSPGYTRYIAR
ncbi:MAG: hypothetical protein ACYTG7_15725, partial [Planctomycetota bacterium]